MYPYYTLLTAERREADAGRLGFWNSMHFPDPMAAFDVIAIDGPYYALAKLAEPRVRDPAALSSIWRRDNLASKRWRQAFGSGQAGRSVRRPRGAFRGAF